MKIRYASLAIAFLIAGCGSADEPDAAQNVADPAVEAPKAAPQEPATPQQFHASFEEAMTAIPPDLRDDFQKLWACEIERNNARPADQQDKIDGAWVIRKTAELKANPSIANCA